MLRSIISGNFNALNDGIVGLLGQHFVIVTNCKHGTIQLILQHLHAIFLMSISQVSQGYAVNKGIGGVALINILVMPPNPRTCRFSTARYKPDKECSHNGNTNNDFCFHS